MKVLIVGGGGREHALAWKCASSDRVHQVFVAPGNAGTAMEPKVLNVDVAADDIDGLLKFAIDEDIDLTIIGPEGPLVAGIVDRFRAADRRCFGPSAKAARLEGSKAFTKDFLNRHRIPTASFATFTAANFDESYVRAQRLPLVVKADGLAAGKGVVICETHESALSTARAMLGGSFGAAGNTIVIEEFLQGEEVSFIVVAGDSQVIALATSQDHKRRDDGDKGPNTGGMGAYSPAPIVTSPLHQRIMREVIEPTLKGLRADGNPYLGFLYAGLMIAADGTPNVLEFNCRFGDPETQPILMRLQSDLVDLCEAALDGTLGEAEVRWDPRAALGVVMAAGGYPDAYRKGDPITGLEAAAALPGKVFHAGTRIEGTHTVTAGGRVLCAVGLGDTVSAAQLQAYNLVHAIHWNLVQYRLDIGYRAIKR
ncbi:MAG TPA: phosphoribosylamine--glycine ligase [Steroidobacteraceae bacterium]|jgi:phosphoribosylamine--glycine ligase|nr:phosphoribosylamine--glycine ligase [Steroidobacteraceae bacterium]